MKFVSFPAYSMYPNNNLSISIKSLSRKRYTIIFQTHIRWCIASQQKPTEEQRTTYTRGLIDKSGSFFIAAAERLSLFLFRKNNNKNNTTMIKRRSIIRSCCCCKSERRTSAQQKKKKKKEKERVHGPRSRTRPRDRKAPRRNCDCALAVFYLVLYCICMHFLSRGIENALPMRVGTFGLRAGRASTRSPVHIDLFLLYVNF